MRGVNYHRAWEAEAEGDVAGIDLAQEGGQCFVGTASGQLVFYGPDGEPRWQSSLPNPVAGVRCGRRGGHAVALTSERELAAFDGDGELLWIKELPFEADCFDLRPGSNLITVGNRYGIYRYLTIHGKLMSGGRLNHPIDFVRFAPGGGSCALACEDGHVSLIEGADRVRWTVFVHRAIIGLDVAVEAQFILVPSRDRGIVAIDADGQGVGVYELREPIRVAEVDDTGKHIVLLDHNGKLMVLDREARLLFMRPCFSAAADGEGKLRVAGESWVEMAAGSVTDSDREHAPLPLVTDATRLAVNGDGSRLAVAGSGGAVQYYRRSDVSIEASEFVEVGVKAGTLRREGDDPVGYLEV